MISTLSNSIKHYLTPKKAFSEGLKHRRAKNVTGMIFMQSKTTKTLKIAFAEEQKRRRARAKNVTEKMYRLSNAI